MKKKMVFLTLFVVIVSFMTGCTNGSPETAIHPKNAFTQFKDGTGKEITLQKKPERMVVLNTEMQSLMFQIDAKNVVGISSAAGFPIPKGAESIQSVGQIQNVNVEKIVSLKPDLVIGNLFFHANLKETLAANRIPLALFSIKTVPDLTSAATLLGKITEKEKQTQEALEQTKLRMESMIAKLPNRKTKFATLTFMPNSVTVQKSGSISLDIAQMLKLENVASTLPSGLKGGAAPYSLEKLVELDPDVLFLIVHGTQELGDQMLKKNMESNPSWGTLRAVKEKRVFFLPSTLFVNSPGLQVDQSLEYMAKLVYPDVYGQVQK
ncbi:iron complex transport system substrate-binding protein [Croceifilum oryzae]|uniref:Iron complex transport system substrate-binding protein n=1 Tax=Croceifilum oryzae TaxID=1553429 RepID=A0AAJ1TKK5_9BACL|nr:ABC transporter substrate-binding protein [Croceifilum oryzae]MDQ0418582.1 iron complex transport system substrate-binding protein [Croceifilum oryzae]